MLRPYFCAGPVITSYSIHYTKLYDDTDRVGHHGLRFTVGDLRVIKQALAGDVQDDTFARRIREYELRWQQHRRAFAG